MKRAIIVIIALLLVVGGVALGWYLVSQPAQQTTQQDTSEPTEPIGNQVAEEPATGEVTVKMQNTKFNPTTITIRKGTKVTWANEDSVQHNVVASDANNTGGLPTQNPVFGKGGSYSFSFDTAGTFKYHCTPHPFMTGTVIVE